MSARRVTQRAQALTLEQLQARRAAFHAIKAQRQLDAEERAEADRLDQRLYMRVWRAVQAEHAQQRRPSRRAAQASVKHHA